MNYKSIITAIVSLLLLATSAVAQSPALNISQITGQEGTYGQNDSITFQFTVNNNARAETPGNNAPPETVQAINRRNEARVARNIRFTGDLVGTDIYGNDVAIPVSLTSSANQIDPGESFTYTGRVTVPVDGTLHDSSNPGYRVTGELTWSYNSLGEDEDDSSDDSVVNEGPSTISSNSNVLLSFPTNLLITDLDYPSGTFFGGDLIQVTAYVLNQSTTPNVVIRPLRSNEDFRTEFYLSDDASLDTNNDFSLGFFTLTGDSVATLNGSTTNALTEERRVSVEFTPSRITSWGRDYQPQPDDFFMDVGEVVAVTLEVMVPRNYSGTYFLGSITDSLSEIAELVEPIDGSFGNQGDNIYVDDFTPQIRIASSNAPTTEPVSEISDGNGGLVALSDGLSDKPTISEDGQWIAFQSQATNLDPALSGSGNFNIYLRNRETEEVTLISRNNTGAIANRDSLNPSISANGRYVAYESLATNLVSGIQGASSHIYVYDRLSDSVVRVSVSSLGIPANGDCYEPSINEDGRFVAFESIASNLESDFVTELNSSLAVQVFIHDRDIIGTGLYDLKIATHLVSSVGSAVADGNALNPQISLDAQTVVFVSDATNLDASMANGFSQIWKRDIGSDGVPLGDVEIVSINADGTSGGDGNSLEPAINGGLSTPNYGLQIAFASTATDLIVSDTNDVADIFIRDYSDQLSPVTTRASVSNPRVAFGTITFAGAINSDNTPLNQPSNGDTITLNDGINPEATYIFGGVPIGLDLTETQNNLPAAIANGLSNNIPGDAAEGGGVVTFDDGLGTTFDYTYVDDFSVVIGADTTETRNNLATAIDTVLMNDLPDFLPNQGDTVLVSVPGALTEVFTYVSAANYVDDNTVIVAATTFETQQNLVTSINNVLLANIPVDQPFAGENVVIIGAGDTKTFNYIDLVGTPVIVDPDPFNTRQNLFAAIFNDIEFLVPAAQPVAGDFVTLDEEFGFSLVFTFVAEDDPFNVPIGFNTAETRDNLVEAINTTEDLNMFAYSSDPANSDVNFLELDGTAPSIQIFNTETGEQGNQDILTTSFVIFTQGMEDGGIETGILVEDYEQGLTYGSLQPTLDRSGRIVAFRSLVGNISAADEQTRYIKGPSNQTLGTPEAGEPLRTLFRGASNVYYRDRDGNASGQLDTIGNTDTVRASVSKFGYPTNQLLGVANSASSRMPALSANGRFIAFATEATSSGGLRFDRTNTQPLDTNNFRDVYVHDRKTVVDLTEGPVEPVFTAPTVPVGITARSGENFFFKVVADGIDPIVYQWRKDGVNFGDSARITGASTGELVITNLQPSDAGVYDAVAQNQFGAATSLPITLTIGSDNGGGNQSLTIDEQPEDSVKPVGGSALFEVTASASETITYQWTKDGGNLADGGNVSGANTAQLQIFNLTADDAGFYSVKVWTNRGDDDEEEEESNDAQLAIQSAPVIVTQPQGIALDVGQSGQLEVEAISVSNLTYQWFKGGTLIRGAISPTYVIASAATIDEGSYYVRVTNGFGSQVVSQTASVQVGGESLADMPAPLSGAESLGEDWYHSSWFGYFASPDSSNWIYRTDLGWLYIADGGDANGFWSWCGALNSWLWTSQSTAVNGFYYKWSDGDWIFILPNESGYGAWIRSTDTDVWSELSL